MAGDVLCVRGLHIFALTLIVTFCILSLATVFLIDIPRPLWRIHNSKALDVWVSLSCFRKGIPYAPVVAVFCLSRPFQRRVRCHDSTVGWKRGVPLRSPEPGRM